MLVAVCHVLSLVAGCCFRCFAVRYWCPHRSRSSFSSSSSSAVPIRGALFAVAFAIAVTLCLSPTTDRYQSQSLLSRQMRGIPRFGVRQASVVRRRLLSSSPSVSLLLLAVAGQYRCQEPLSDLAPIAAAVAVTSTVTVTVTFSKSGCYTGSVVTGTVTITVSAALTSIYCHRRHYSCYHP